MLRKINVVVCYNPFYNAVIYSRSAKSYMQRGFVLLVSINNYPSGKILSNINKYRC